MKKFEQMKRLHGTISKYIDPYNCSDALISGTTADFDRLFELSWKTLKEYLHGQLGISEAKSGSPKIIIKIAYREGLIHDEKIWGEMLRYRNDDTHQYRKSDALLYVSRIADKYLDEIEKLIDELRDIIPDEVIEDVEIPESMIAYCRERGISLADFVMELEVRLHYEDADSVFRSWEKIRQEL